MIEKKDWMDDRTVEISQYSGHPDLWGWHFFRILRGFFGIRLARQGQD
jgi:hypothetical protein